MMGERPPRAFYSFPGSAQELAYALFGSDACVLLGGSPLSCCEPESGSIVDISFPTYGGVNPARIKACAYIQHMGRVLGDRATGLYCVWGDAASSAVSPLPDHDAAGLAERQDAFLAVMRAENDAASAIAHYLACHPLVERVFYPGLKSDGSFAAATQLLAHGFGNIIDYRLTGYDEVFRIQASSDDPFVQIGKLETALAALR